MSQLPEEEEELVEALLVGLLVVVDGLLELLLRHLDEAGLPKIPDSCHSTFSLKHFYMY